METSKEGDSSTTPAAAATEAAAEGGAAAAEAAKADGDAPAEAAVQPAGGEPAAQPVAASDVSPGTAMPVGSVAPVAAAAGVAAPVAVGVVDGVPGAAEPQVLGGVQLPAKQALDLKHERLTGIVSKYTPSNGYGVLTSHMFEGDLTFRNERIMPEFQGHPLHEGEAVEFDVQADDSGNAHAVALKPVLGRRPVDCLGQRHRGYVRRFAERWGFLNAAAFDGDLFVHRDNLLPVPEHLQDGQPILRAGQAVEFDVALDDRGRAVAKQITTRALLRPCDWIGHRVRGYIRSFQGAWGFINSDKFAGDLFVHRDSLLANCQSAPLAIGTIVEFDVERDHHRKGAKNRLVARHVGVIGVSDPTMQLQQQAYAASFGAHQAGMPMDMTSYGGAPSVPLPGQAPMYYAQGGTVAVGDPSLAAYGMPPAAYPYPQHPQYPHMQQHPLMPQQPVSPYGHSPYAPQPAYGAHPHQPLAHLLPQPAPPAQVSPAAHIPPAVPAPAPVAPNGAPPAGMPDPTKAPGHPLAATTTSPTAAPGGVVSATAADGSSQGMLHITMHDWEPDQPGQLWVTKGTLVNVSYRAAHGWVYAGTVQPGDAAGEPASEGWIPQAVVKRVSLCRVFIDWPAEGSGTLGVSKGEIIAVSKEAERGWVYGERIGPRVPDRPSDGWLPKKVLEYLQS
eukprot:TRINITY_DN42203_c0_g1_i1.p1 TRINITY_DN42203_c0_g1~~TRINITY_DN42203_c0_g1_i1.p1  ORF type:complete len:673 (-),score=141.02 TRINITY_DN42203_c0_g1_i1:185-2203(-)